MPKFRVERTEFHTRVFYVEAKDEDEALETYSEQEEEHSYHSWEPDVRVEEVKPQGAFRCGYCGR